jgi:hypothetical protein
MHSLSVSDHHRREPVPQDACPARPYRIATSGIHAESIPRLEEGDELAASVVQTLAAVGLALAVLAVLAVLLARLLRLDHAFWVVLGMPRSTTVSLSTGRAPRRAA